jgi:hypothetical protein
MAKINNWYPFGNSLIGEITEHPRRAEFSGELQRTSTVLGKKGDKVITRNTEYELGTPHSSIVTEQYLATLQEIH